MIFSNPKKCFNGLVFYNIEWNISIKMEFFVRFGLWCTGFSWTLKLKKELHFLWEAYVLARNLTQEVYITMSSESILFSIGQFLLRIFIILYNALHYISFIPCFKKLSNTTSLLLHQAFIFLQGILEGLLLLHFQWGLVL